MRSPYWAAWLLAWGLFCTLLAGGVMRTAPGQSAPAAPAAKLAAGGDPAANTAALQAIVDATPVNGSARVDFGPGTYQFAGPVRVPADRILTLDGHGVARLQRVGADRDLVTFTPSDRWFWGQFVMTGFDKVYGRLTCDNATGPTCLNELVVERCDFWVSQAYPVDLKTGYSFAPTVRDCQFHGGGIRWGLAPGAPEPHATSQLLIDRVLVNTDGDNRPGPDIHLKYCQMATVRGVTCQGSTGWYMAGVDPAATWYTTSVLIEAPGPRGGRVQDAWCEYWNYGPDGMVWCDVQVRNTFPGAAGAYEVRDFVLENVSGGHPWQPVVVSAVKDATNVLRVDSRGGSAPTASGPVVVRRWLTGALEDRARSAKSPVWDWR